MRISEELLVNADPSTVYRVAAEVAEWPELMPHFRWIHARREAGGRVSLVMAARVGLLPLRWHADQTLYPAQTRMVLRHVGGPTAGMIVELRFAETPSGTLATVVSSLDLGWPLVGGLVEAVVVGVLSRWLARRTLLRLKLLAEAERADLERLEGESLAGGQDAASIGD